MARQRCGWLGDRVTGREGAIDSGAMNNGGLTSANVRDDWRQVGENSLAVGNGSIADRDNPVSVDSQGKECQATKVAAVAVDIDAVNVAQLKQMVRYGQNADGNTDYRRVSLGQQVRW